jgi:hypothetical protein
MTIFLKLSSRSKNGEPHGLKPVPPKYVTVRWRGFLRGRVIRTDLALFKIENKEPISPKG